MKKMTFESYLLFSVKSQIYNLLGEFAEAFPETMIAYSDRLFDVYIRALREQVSIIL